MKIVFLCGCETGNVEDRANFATMDSVDIDHEGMVICARHGLRRQHWRSLPTTNVQVVVYGDIDGESGTKPAIDWNMASWTPKQVEGFALFGEVPAVKTVAKVESSVVDVRDNRDPEEVGREILSKSDGHQ